MTDVRALSIAGFDPTGGAGVLQDVRTFSASGVWGLAVVAAITAQDTRGVHAWGPVPLALVRAQIEHIVDDAPPAASKTGMLGTADHVRLVASLAASLGPIVVDPVWRATTGGALGTDDVVDALRTDLLPVAAVVTPNSAEATALTGITCEDLASMRAAAQALVELGARAAIVTGGHVGGDDAVDVVLDATGAMHELRAPRVATTDDHGTGCVFSSSIAAGLARGMSLEDAARAAKGMVVRALQNAQHFGGGSGPVTPVSEARPWPLAGHPFE